MMNTSGLLFALLTTVSWSIGIFPFTEAAKRMGANPLNHFRLLLATILLVILAIAADPFGFSDLFSTDRQQAWIWLGLSGVVGLTVGDYFGFAMFAILGPRTGSVLTTFAPGAALAVGIFLTGDKLSLTGIIGMAVTIFGVIAISLSRSERDSIPESRHGSLLKGIIFGVLAAFCQGAGLALAKMGLLPSFEGQKDVHPFQATFIRMAIATGSLFLLTTLQGKWSVLMPSFRGEGRSGMKYAILGTLFGPVIGVSLSLATVARLEASVAQTVFSLVPVCVLLITLAYHKQPLRWQTGVGVFVAVAGVIVLVWRDKIEDMFHQLIS
ncbi:MAG: DMT family transporter [Bacteroidota bacterium]